MATRQDAEGVALALSQMSRTYGDAMVASYNEAIRRSRPKFNQAAREAAGPDQMLSRLGRRAKLTVKFRIINGSSATLMYVNPVGPWGIRDNTDAGGKTAKHTIRPKRVTKLKFDVGGETFYATKVSHPGSARAPYWERGRTEALKVVQTRVPIEVRKMILAAINNRPYKSRPIRTG